MTTKITSNKITHDQKDEFFKLVLIATKKAFKQARPTRKGLQNLFSRGGEFQKYLIAGIKRYSSELPDYNLARSILGKDFISPEEIAKVRNIVYTDEQIIKLGQAPELQDEQYLKWCRDNNYMLVAGPNHPMSLLEIRIMNNGYFYSKESGWYTEQKQRFAQDDKVETKWYTIRKDIVPESTSKNWNEQQAMLSEIEVTPNAPEFIWAITTYKAVRDIYLFGGVYARTSSIDSGGDHVIVGYFDGEGLVVDSYWVATAMAISGCRSLGNDT